MSRLLVKGELRHLRPNRIDSLYLAWIAVGGLAYIVQRADFSAIVFVCGTSLDMLGAYLLARALIATMADLRQFAKIASLLAICVSLFFFFELSTGRNLFSIFGGVPATTVIRDNRLRCQGAFAHPILAGVFWASICALLIGAALGAKNRLLPFAGATSCVVIIGASASSTPVLGLLAAVAFWLCWPTRTKLRYAFAAMPIILTALHLVMDAPVWHLVARVSAVGGSTGYHRFVLIDSALNHFHEWWLVGTKWTGHWSEHFQTWTSRTNTYLKEFEVGFRAWFYFFV